MKRAKQDPPGQPDLFGRGSPASSASSAATGATSLDDGLAPLPERLRPRELTEVVGQQHLVGEGKPLARALEAGRVPSLILWGPPGSGKTTLAGVLAKHVHARFVPYSAVHGSLPELRQHLERARLERVAGRGTVLFVDEIHRFNKAQQDAFLPAVETGDVTLVGATTENPSFACNAALLSRCRVLRLLPLEEHDLVALVARALESPRGFAGELAADDDAARAVARLADGDARRALHVLEGAVAEARGAGRARVVLADVEAAAGSRALVYDKAGEEHYNVVSAFIKSMRGSDPDAALYWMFRMLDAGEDPLFVARRMIVFASEDIGNADPRALEVAVAADAAYQRMGMPEGNYPLAHACLFLATAPKSNGVKSAMLAARAAIEAKGSLPVPMKLRNAVTKLMKSEGYGDGYRYPHDEAGGFAPGETYLPDALAGARFYEPTERGYEKTIRERLARLRGPREPE